MFDNIVEKERAVLVSVDTGEFDAETSLDELEELANTAEAQVIGRMTQKRPSPDSATYIGSGRLEELKEFCQSNEIDLIIFDAELSPSQQYNIEKFTDIRVIDRTTLILDIFAQRARSGEGKLQVELAQLRYRLPRLRGMGVSMSRLGGGIGTRGPGETKLESDKRHIRRRINALEDDLKKLEERRRLAGERRKKNRVETVAIVGYTNAGKSTLMNTLTNAGVLAENKLFATLDVTARALILPDGRQVMLIDTVGLVRRLPHHLVEAFKSTLEQAAQADVILNVCDASSPDAQEHLEVTREILEQLGCMDRPIISVMNKCDLVSDVSLPVIGTSVEISALNGTGIERLLEVISSSLVPTRSRVKLLLPFKESGTAARLHTDGVVHFEEYRPEGIFLDVTASIELLKNLAQYTYTGED